MPVADAFEADGEGDPGEGDEDEEEAPVADEAEDEGDFFHLRGEFHGFHDGSGEKGAEEDDAGLEEGEEGLDAVLLEGAHGGDEDVMDVCGWCGVKD